MTSTDKRADNLIARLFAYSPRTGERLELENYCTEALAWCLIISKPFAAKFLDAIRKSLESNLQRQRCVINAPLQVSTQISFKGEDILQDEGDDPQTRRGGRFDLVLASGKLGGCVIVIETKVKFDLDLDKQVTAYRRALTNQAVRAIFGNFDKAYVVTLTPSTRHETPADAHLSWGQIHCLISGHLNVKQEPREFSAFADFLKLNHLSFMNIPPITSSVIKNFQHAAAFLNNLNELFARFKNDEVLKKFFRPSIWDRPVVDFDDNVSWYGVGGQKVGRWVYAGFFVKDDFAGLSVEIEYAGDRLEETKKLERNAKHALEEAKRLLGSRARIENRSTWLFFAHKIEPSEVADDHLKWFTTIFSAVSKAFDEP
jgi:hypothetical protein